MNEALWKLRTDHLVKLICHERRAVFPAAFVRHVIAERALATLECYRGGRIRLLLWIARSWVSADMTRLQVRLQVRWAKLTGRDPAAALGLMTDRDEEWP